MDHVGTTPPEIGISQANNDDFCTRLKLPERIYVAGKEPDILLNVTHHSSNLSYVEKVAKILGPEEFGVIKTSCIGPIVKLAQRSTIQFSSKLFHFLIQRRLLTTGDDLWFAFANQPMRFSLREFFLTTGLKCQEEEEQGREESTPNDWMLDQGKPYTLGSLYQLLLEEGNMKSRLEKMSLGLAIITEAVVIGEDQSSIIPTSRLLDYGNLDRFSSIHWGRLGFKILSDSIRKLTPESWKKKNYEVKGFLLAFNLWALSSVLELGRAFGKQCHHTSSDPYCLHWQSTRVSRISEILEFEKFNDVVVHAELGNEHEFQNLVQPMHDEDMDFKTIIQLVQHRYRMKKSDWVKGYVDIFSTTEEISNTRRRKDIHSPTSQVEKVDKVINMVKGLLIRVAAMEEILGVDPRKEEEDEVNTEGNAEGNEENAQKPGVDSEANTEGNDENTQKPGVDSEANTQVLVGEEGTPMLGDIDYTQKLFDSEDTEKIGEDEDTEKTGEDIWSRRRSSPADIRRRLEVAMIADSSTTETIQNVNKELKECDNKEQTPGVDSEANTQVLVGEEGTPMLGDIEYTQKLFDSEDTEKIGEDEDTEKTGEDEETKNIEEDNDAEVLDPTDPGGSVQDACGSVKETEIGVNQKTQVISLTPIFSTPTFNLLSKESSHNILIEEDAEDQQSGNKTNEQDDVAVKSDFQPLMKKKKRSAPQRDKVTEKSEPLLKKKRDDVVVAPRRSDRGQIPSIHTQPPFTGARKKHPIIHPFEPVDKIRMQNLTKWSKSKKCKVIKLLDTIVNANWFANLETPGKMLSERNIEAGLELLRTRKEANLFLNESASILSVTFLDEIDQLFEEFLENKDEINFGGFEKYNIKKGIDYLYAVFQMEEDCCWIGVEINLEKRKITAMNCAAAKHSDEAVKIYVNAYAKVVPHVMQHIFKDENMDTREFCIHVDSKSFPQASKMEDTGIYALKLIECQAMRIRDLSKLTEEKLPDIRKKLAAVIFSELQ